MGAGICSTDQTRTTVWTPPFTDPWLPAKNQEKCHWDLGIPRGWGEDAVRLITVACVCWLSSSSESCWGRQPHLSHWRSNYLCENIGGTAWSCSWGSCACASAVSFCDRGLLRGGGVTERGGGGRFHAAVRGTMFVRNGAMTPGPSRECDITFFPWQPTPP